MQSVDNKPGTVSELLPHVASNFQPPTSNLLSAKCPLRLRFHENIFSPQLLLFCVDFPALVTLICEYIHHCFCKFSGNCELRLSRLLLIIFQCWWHFCSLETSPLFLYIFWHWCDCVFRPHPRNHLVRDQSATRTPSNLLIFTLQQIRHNQFSFYIMYLYLYLIFLTYNRTAVPIHSL